jgi:predicted amidohydrolase YtcJ
MHDDWNINYSDYDDGNIGLTYLEPEVLMQQIRLFHNAGIHMGIHSIGDRAIDFTMDAYDTVLKENPISGLRHSIIHSNLPTEHALDLMVRLQTEFDTGYPEIQPAFLWWIGDAYAGNFGPERSKHVLPMKTFLERGIRWGGSSDYDVSPYAPGYSLWAAAERETLNGTHGSNPWGKDESIGVMDSIRAYTRWSARQVFLEDKIGSIETGKYADIVVWDRDPLTVPTEELKELKAVLTLMNGNAVHGDLTSPM